MNFNGEIVFAIADDNPIEVDFGEDMLPTRIINKDDVIALGRKAPKYRWIYEIKYNDEQEYIEILEEMFDKLCKRKEYIKELMAKYDEVDITIYIRSEFAQIGYSLPSHILKKVSSLGCKLHFDILSFSMVMDENT